LEKKLCGVYTKEFLYCKEEITFYLHINQSIKVYYIKTQVCTTQLKIINKETSRNTQGKVNVAPEAV
jgi:hypothetical protein